MRPSVQFPELLNMLAWADESSLRILLVAVAAALLALLVHRVGSVLVLRLTRTMPRSTSANRDIRDSTRPTPSITRSYFRARSGR